MGHSLIGVLCVAVWTVQEPALPHPEHGFALRRRASKNRGMCGAALLKSRRRGDEGASTRRGFLREGTLGGETDQPVSELCGVVLDGVREKVRAPSRSPVLVYNVMHVCGM